MSIIGIGIDIIEIKRIKNIICRFGKKFVNRILTLNEYKIYRLLNSNSEKFLSKRFVAKEAIVKALGLGFTNGITFHSFEIYNNKLGKPKIRFFNNAKKKLNIRKVHLSLTDEKKYACAMVICEK